MTHFYTRNQRYRAKSAVRTLLKQTHILPEKLVHPLFILPGSGRQEEVPHLKGVMRQSTDAAIQTCRELEDQGAQGVLLFPCIPSQDKDDQASYATRPDQFLFDTIAQIKRHTPNLLVFVDVALDPFTSHGHDGLLTPQGLIDNDQTVQVLTEMARLLAEQGVDVLAPSDMMDGRILSIRHMLETRGFHDVAILAYTAKFASSFYGPFRHAVGSTQKTGIDKRSYHLNPANLEEALRQAQTDEREGADFLLVKPALPYLDVLTKIKQQTHLPVGAYHVSGELAMLQAAAQAGIVDYDRALEESLTALFRGGADFVITYARNLRLS